MTVNGRDSAIVVGGGIVGVACAHYLADAGYEVTVIDQSGIGEGCSHANCGYVCPSHVLPLSEPGAVLEGVKSLFTPGSAFRIKPQLRLGLYRWLFEFARRCNYASMLETAGKLQPLLESSMSEYRALFDAAGPAGEWADNGLLYVFESEGGFEDFARTNAMLRENFDLAARRIEGDELPELDSAYRGGLAGAFLYDCDASVRPDILIRDWQSRLAMSGVTFIENCRFDGVARSAGQIDALQTSGGEMTADRYVFAMGAWSSELGAELGCSIPVEPGKGYSLTTSRPENCPQHPALFPERRIGITPFEHSYRIGSMMEFAGFDTSIPEQRMTLLRNSARPYLKTPVGTDIEETWYGWRPMTWDSLPIVGRIPGLDNGLLATGHSMLGVSLAPVTGRLIAELAQEQPTHIDIDALSPARF